LFGPRYGEKRTVVRRKKKATLMPAITLAALSLMVALPTLSSMHLYAATAQRFTTVTVQPGDTLWSIAAAHTNESGDVQASIDRISETNHLTASTLQPGQHLRIPI
jgi:predicted Zn-dependent protease